MGVIVTIIIIVFATYIGLKVLGFVLGTILAIGSLAVPDKETPEEAQARLVEISRQAFPKQRRKLGLD